MSPKQTQVSTPSSCDSSGIPEMERRTKKVPKKSWKVNEFIGESSSLVIPGNRVKLYTPPTPRHSFRYDLLRRTVASILVDDEVVNRKGSESKE